MYAHRVNCNQKQTRRKGSRPLFSANSSPSAPPLVRMTPDDHQRRRQNMPTNAPGPSIPPGTTSLLRPLHTLSTLSTPKQNSIHPPTYPTPALNPPTVCPQRDPQTSPWAYRASSSGAPSRRCRPAHKQQPCRRCRPYRCRCRDYHHHHRRRPRRPRRHPPRRRPAPPPRTGRRGARGCWRCRRAGS